METASVLDRKPSLQALRNQSLDEGAFKVFCGCVSDIVTSAAAKKDYKWLCEREVESLYVDCCEVLRLTYREQKSCALCVSLQDGLFQY